jgi:hypothetical protein
MEILTVCMYRAKRTLNFKPLNFKPVRQLTINITLVLKYLPPAPGDFFWV